MSGRRRSVSSTEGNTKERNAQPSIFDELRGVSSDDETLCRILDITVRQKYSTARRIFISLSSVSSGDKTLRLMLDILREVKKHCHFHSIS